MKVAEPQHDHYLHRHKDEEDISRLAEQLAPPEEAAAKTEDDRTSTYGDGTLIIEKDTFKFSNDFEEYEQEPRGIFGHEPVVFVILAVLIAFIALIAYLVYKMPSPAN